VPAAVIASVDDRNDIPQAGVTNLTPAEKHGRELFGRSCGLCHTLKAANAIATVGPNLDQLKPSAAVAERQVRSGGGGMPAFGDQLSDQQIKAVADYVARSAGRGSR
jgi:mono/diheme cytochrome c family protein